MVQFGLIYCFKEEISFNQPIRWKNCQLWPCLVTVIIHKHNLILNTSTKFGYLFIDSLEDKSVTALITLSIGREKWLLLCRSTGRSGSTCERSLIHVYWKCQIGRETWLLFATTDRETWESQGRRCLPLLPVWWALIVSSIPTNSAKTLQLK